MLFRSQIAGSGTNGYALGVQGNVTQNLENFGLPKAMIAIGPLGAIQRCFNSTISGIGMTAPPCGFIAGSSNEGVYFINFGFPVTSRFLLITLERASEGASTLNSGVYAFTANPNQIEVDIFSTFHLSNAPFTVIVF